MSLLKAAAARQLGPFLSIQSHIRNLAKQNEYHKGKRIEYENSLQETPTRGSGLAEAATEAREQISAATQIDSPDTQPARMKAAVAHVATAIIKQCPGATEIQLESLLREAFQGSCQPGAAGLWLLNLHPGQIPLRLQ